MVKKEPVIKVRSLHEDLGIEDVDLVAYIDQVRSGGPETLDERLDPKVRRNALTAVFIERMWKIVQRREDGSPETSGLNAHTAKELDQIAKTGEFAAVITAFDMTTQRHLIDCSAEHATASDSVTEALSSEYVNAVGKTLITYPDRVHAGIRNASTMSWQSIRAIPYLHQQRVEGDKMLDAESYQRLCERNISLLRNLAHSHLSVFSVAAQSTCSGQSFPVFDSAFMRMVGENGARHLELSPQIVPYTGMCADEIKRTSSSKFSTGCPALAVTAPNGKDIASAMYEWILRLASKYFFPHTQAMLERSELKSSLQMQLDDMRQLLDVLRNEQK